MIISSARNLFSLAILGFAVMGFVAVPIFGKTGYQHVQNLISSPSGQAIGKTAESTLVEMKSRIEADLKEREDAQNEATDDTPENSRVIRTRTPTEQ